MLFRKIVLRAMTDFKRRIFRDEPFRKIVLKVMAPYIFKRATLSGILGLGITFQGYGDNYAISYGDTL